MKDNTKNKTGKFNIKLNYWTGLIIYAVVLLIIGICVYIYIQDHALRNMKIHSQIKLWMDFLKTLKKWLMIRLLRTI